MRKPIVGRRDRHVGRDDCRQVWRVASGVPAHHRGNLRRTTGRRPDSADIVAVKLAPHRPVVRGDISIYPSQCLVDVGRVTSFSENASTRAFRRRRWVPCRNGSRRHVYAHCRDTRRSAAAQPLLLDPPSMLEPSPPLAMADAGTIAASSHGRCWNHRRL